MTATAQRSVRQAAILAALEDVPHMTEHFQRVGRCTLAEAIVELLRLEAEGLARRGGRVGGMTWRAT